MQMGTARILSPLCVFLSRSSFLSPVTEQCRTPPLLHYHVSISVSFYSYPCLFSRWLSVCQFAAAAAVSCLRIECIAFNIYSLLFPFSATFFFFSLLRTFFFPSAQEKRAKYRTENRKRHRQVEEEN